MKKFKLLAMFGICGIVLAACGGEDTSSEVSSPAEESTAVEETIVEGQTENVVNE
ncbi:hypothetical protein [Carnobacterium sp.]|uniref:hypothetical protein n=1 Tax=Carnobacterium sp. TaxID=48221 RepID=UPI00388E8870